MSVIPLTEEQRQTVADNFYMVKMVARQLYEKYHNHVMYDDLIGWGSEGLIRAVQLYRETGLAFKSYAMTKIKWTIIDRMRTDRWFSGVTKPDRRYDPMVREETDCEIQKLLYEVTPEQVAIDKQRMERLIAKSRLLLNYSEQHIFYGLLNGKSLLDIGADLGVTSSRIYQIRKQIIETLRESDSDAWSDSQVGSHRVYG